MEASADGVAELAMHMSRRLSIDFGSLIKGLIVPKGAVARVAFKHGVNTDSSSLQAASFIASSLAQAVLAAMPTHYRPLPISPSDLRRQASDLTSGPFGFEALLNICWDHGIPVIPLPNLPVGIRKMDGAVLQIGERPVIILAKKKSSRAWLSFILAHEIGHIILGHLQPGSTIVDISLQETSTYLSESSKDLQESDADTAALEIMGGAAVSEEIARWSSNDSPVELAVNARSASATLNIEAGHFILRHAFATKRWPEAIVALRFLSEDFHPESALLGQMKKRLDMDLVATDLQDLVAQVTGWNSPS
jgi:hypothetical protein